MGATAGRTDPQPERRNPKGRARQVALPIVAQVGDQRAPGPVLGKDARARRGRAPRIPREKWCDMTEITVTYFHDKGATRKQERRISLIELAQQIRTATAPEKDELGWLKLARFGDAATAKGSLRHDRNLLAVTGVEIDYDGEQVDVGVAIEKIEKTGLSAIVYTSPSHRPEAPRWRVLCPFSQELPPDQRGRMVNRINRVLGGVAGTESWTLSQAYFFGSVSNNPHHRVELVDGVPIDTLDELDRIAIGKPGTQSSPSARAGGPQGANGAVDKRALLDEIITGAAYHTPAMRLLGSWAMQGVPMLEAKDQLVAAFECVFPPDRDERWRDRVESIPEMLSYIWPKEAEKRDAGSGKITVKAGERHIAADEGIAALQKAGTAFYQRDRALVRVCKVKAKAADGDIIFVPGIAVVTPAILERELGIAAQWERLDPQKSKTTRIDPPRPVVNQILDMIGEWPFPPIAGVIGCPTLRRDGSLLADEGYDLAAGLVLISAVSMPPIQEAPTRNDALAAAGLLDELLAEFPFADPTSKSVALSMMMTPVLRGAMSVAPMHLVRAPESGSGKSYLADVASMISTGERVAVKSVAPKPEETEKRLIGSALAGYPIIGLDNCRETLEGAFLCQLTERPLLELRVLGKSDIVRVANTFTTFATGNNVTVADDLVRRTICCSLDANVENPEGREFLGDPIADVRRNPWRLCRRLHHNCAGIHRSGETWQAAPIAKL
jgi:hypothetical protein